MSALAGTRSDQHPAGELGREEHRDRGGQEAEAGDQGRVALDVLEELGEEEDHAVHAGVAEAPGHVGGGPGPVGQDAQRQDGLGRGGLDVHEQAEQGHARRPATPR